MMRDPYEVVYILLAGFLYILFAGLYAGLYTYARMTNSRVSLLGSLLFCFLMVASAVPLVKNSLFDPFWKGLISIATVVYTVIPFGMWKVVVTIEELKHREAKNLKER